MYTEIISAKIAFVSKVLLFVCAVSLVGCEEKVPPPPGAVRLKFYPSSSVNEGVGETNYVQITVENAVDLFSARVKISFDPSVVEVTEVMTSGPSYMFYDSGADTEVLESYYDNEKGEIVFGIGAVKQGFTGVSGEGVLALIYFKGKSANTTALSFVNINPDDIILAKYSNESAKGWEEQAVEVHNGSILVK